MKYPQISEYYEAILNAEDNFKLLRNLRPILDDNGYPIGAIGDISVVFKMKDIVSNKLLAVKCFIKEQNDRSERYSKIADELQHIYSPYILPVRYIERELIVDSTESDEVEFPVIVMDWVDGQPLDAYLRNHLDDTYGLQMLAYRFCKMGAWLLSKPFAHGDLKPENIIVRHDGTLVLVDYDGMFVPSMIGEAATEIGSPDFQHPLCKKQSFNEHIDDFSIATIALSLKAISLKPRLFHKYAASNRLLFSASDYLNIEQSSALHAIVPLLSNEELAAILSAFHLALAMNDQSMETFRNFMFSEPEKPVKTLLSTKITDEERKNAKKDKYRAEYSADGLKLIKKSNSRISSYTIKNGTQFIGDGAFAGCTFLQSITIPDSVISIGDNAFEGCTSLQSITIPESVTSIGDWAFFGCSSILSITIPNSVISIGNGAFACCSSILSITIPYSVISIGNSAFAECSSLQSITIQSSVTSIGDGAFNACHRLYKIVLNNPMYYVHDQLLYRSNRQVVSCWSKATNINLPVSVRSIGNSAFQHCSSLQSITIPDSVISIGDNAFLGCSSLQSITIPNSVKRIGEWAFEDCSSLQSITIPNSVKRIGFGIFNGCDSLSKIVMNNTNYLIYEQLLLKSDGQVLSCWSKADYIDLPDIATSIGNSAFACCSSLKHIYIPESVKSIGNHAFDGCDSIFYITIPKRVKSIGDNAFENCSSLDEITIPKNVKSIGDRAFEGCFSLQSINLPDSVKSIGDNVFRGCSSLKEIRIKKGLRTKMLKLLNNKYANELVEI